MAEIERRHVLRGAAAVGIGAAAVPLLAACGNGGGSGGSDPVAGTSSGPKGITVPKSKVPVGGGLIDGTVVVTQPAAGEFKAFSSTCTHQGCTVDQVSDGFIICPCHQSHFAIADGAPTAESMAKSPLPTKNVTASGDNLVIS
jgi:Rieske Fe-S protein